MADTVVTNGKPSVEISRNASGGISIAVKVYAVPAEEQTVSEAQVDAAVTKARAVFDALSAAYPAATKNGGAG